MTQLKGTAFEDNALLFPDALTGPYQESNLVRDGRAKRIALNAARYETVAFQIIVQRANSERLFNVKVKLGELVGPAHFHQHPERNRTRLIVYLLSLDEAYDDTARERMFYYGQLLKDSGAHRLEYRVDGWYPRETMMRLAKILKVAVLGLGA